MKFILPLQLTGIIQEYFFHNCIGISASLHLTSPNQIDQISNEITQISFHAWKWYKLNRYGSGIECIEILGYLSIDWFQTTAPVLFEQSSVSLISLSTNVMARSGKDNGLLGLLGKFFFNAYCFKIKGGKKQLTLNLCIRFCCVKYSWVKLWDSIVPDICRIWKWKLSSVHFNSRLKLCFVKSTLDCKLNFPIERTSDDFQIYADIMRKCEIFVM